MLLETLYILLILVFLYVKISETEPIVPQFKFTASPLSELRKSNLHEIVLTKISLYQLYLS
jgi:hypothetical protein